MLWGAHHGGLELRQSGDGSVRLQATFPYGQAATLSDGGRSGMARREIIASRAFREKIEDGSEIHFLLSHDYAQPLASKQSGTLEVRDTDQAVQIEAVISADMVGVSYVSDFLRSYNAGLIRGLSPGFRLSPAEGSEAVEVRDGAILRTVRAAQVFEFSAVTRPAYSAAQIEARSWTPGQAAPDAGLVRSLARWRV